MGGHDLADERLVSGGDEPHTRAGDSETGEVDPHRAGGRGEGDGAEREEVHEEAQDDAQALAFLIGQPAAGEHKGHHEQPEDAVEHTDGGDVERGDLLHVEAEEVHGHAEGDVAHAVGDEDPGDDAAGEEHAEHGAEVLFEPGEVEGGALVGDGVVFARPRHGDADDHSDDVEPRSRPQHGLEAVILHDPAAGRGADDGDDAVEGLRKAEDARAVVLGGFFGDEGVEAWPHERARSGANRAGEQHPAPVGGANEDERAGGAEEAADGNGAQPAQRVGDPAAEDLQHEGHDLREGVEEPDLCDGGAEVLEVKGEEWTVHVAAQVREDHGDHKGDEHRREQAGF